MASDYEKNQNVDQDQNHDHDGDHSPKIEDIEGIEETDQGDDFNEDILTAGDAITTDMLIWAYSNGVFPMADHRQGQVQWYSADPRAVLPLNDFHASHSLIKRVKRQEFDVRYDTAFRQTIENCACPRKYEGETWINDQIIDNFCELHDMGLAHCIEAWKKPDDCDWLDDPPKTPTLDANGYTLVGGLYGVSLGGAFFGESMFSKVTDASKVCLVHLVEHLKQRNYALLDVQMNSDHMAQFGTIDISRAAYIAQLREALPWDVTWGEPSQSKVIELLNAI